MLDGFQRAEAALFFERRRAMALVAALTIVLGPVAYTLYNARKEEAAVEVGLAPEIKDFAVEEEKPEEEEAEPEPEPADEPPPPPPPNAKVVRVNKPIAVTEIKPPDAKVTETVTESEREKVIEIPEGKTSPGGMGTTPNSGKLGGKPGGTGTETKPVGPVTGGEGKKPVPKIKKELDPTKPIDRPLNATAPKPLATNQSPGYPAKLQDEGITGRYVIKLNVFRDGTVRGMKILIKNNTATGEDAQKKADAAFLAEIVKVVKTWKFTPSTLDGIPITVWHSVTIPFTLRM